MKIKKRYQLPLVALMFQDITIARFGPARLVKHFAGHHELIGGTAEHHAAAREWCSLFGPKSFLRQRPARRMRWPSPDR
jgi:hypothetical protein